MSVEKTKGRSIIISAPSGAGKTTIVHALLNRLEDLTFSVSASSRKPRSNEKNGKDYYFLSVEEFITKKNNDEFLEWEEVYKDHYYGTYKKEVKKIWDNNKAVVFDVDVKGAINLKKQLGKEALSIFIKPLSIEVLENRLRKRKTETESKIKQRIKKAKHEIKSINQFDLIILNDNLEEAIENTYQAVKKYLST